MSYIDPGAKLLQHVDRIAAIKAGSRPAPVNVEIDLSNRCSLGCEWCHFAFTHTRGPLAGKREKPAGAIPGGDLMDAELALSIVDQLAAAGVRSITWTGGGEPTLHPAFDEIIAHTAKYPTLEQGIYTHGGHISPTRAALLKCTHTFVYVSLDASNAGQYKRDKGVDRFDAACEGIKRLADAKGDATIGIGYLVTESNWRAADYAAQLVESLGADYVQFRPTIHYEQDSPGVPSENTGWMEDAERFLERVAAMYPEQVIADLERFEMYRRWGGHGYPTCWWSALQTVITPNGKVWTCVNKREHPGAALGDLSVESFAEVWGRAEVAEVGPDCRVMCRGHIPNTALDQIMRPAPHAAFI